MRDQGFTLTAIHLLLHPRTIMRRTLRCRRQENRIGKTVEAVEQAVGNQEFPRPQSNIIYYFVELRGPPIHRDNNAHEQEYRWASGWSSGHDEEHD